MSQIKESNQVKITLLPETVAFLQAEYPGATLLEIFWQLLEAKHPDAPLKRPKRGEKGVEAMNRNRTRKESVNT